MNALSVIIPSKKIENLRHSLIAVCRQQQRETRIIVIDDGVEWLQVDCAWRSAIYPHQLEIVQGIQPFIFSRNVNLGIHAAGRDDVVILGDDGLLETPCGLSELQRQCAEHPECGLMSASTNAGNANQHRRPGGGVRYDPVMVSFVCVFIPRSTIDTLGLMDEQFGVNAGGPGARGYGLDDDDFCWRARAAGMKLGIYDGCHVDHRSLVSTFRGDKEHPADVFVHERLFQKKWGRHPRNP